MQGGRPHWFVHSTQAQLSYTWALIRCFSDSFAHAVPFTNYTHRISDVPKSGFLHVSLAGYMSSLRTLCLSSTKQDLKHLILDRTACEPEKEQTMSFERMKIAENKEHEVAEEADNKAKTVSHRQDFLFMQAFE